MNEYTKADIIDEIIEGEYPHRRDSVHPGIAFAGGCFIYSFLCIFPGTDIGPWQSHILLRWGLAAVLIMKIFVPLSQKFGRDEEELQIESRRKELESRSDDALLQKVARIRTNKITKFLEEIADYLSSIFIFSAAILLITYHEQFFALLRRTFGIN